MYDKTDNRNYNISQIIVKYLIKHNLIEHNFSKQILNVRSFYSDIIIISQI